MNDDSRNLMVSIELTPEEHEQITTLAVAEERDVPHQIRMLVKEALAARAEASTFTIDDVAPHIRARAAAERTAIDEAIKTQQAGLTRPFLGGGSMTWPVVDGRIFAGSGSHSP